jgi:hypothetical protein
MEYIDRKGAEYIVNSFMEGEMLEYRKSNDRDFCKNIAPEAKEAFNRKPYDSYPSRSFKTHYVRPIIRAHA